MTWRDACSVEAANVKGTLGSTAIEDELDRDTTLGPGSSRATLFGPAFDRTWTA
jgi:hypothetical protein